MKTRRLQAVLWSSALVLSLLPMAAAVGQTPETGPESDRGAAVCPYAGVEKSNGGDEPTCPYRGDARASERACPFTGKAASGETDETKPALGPNDV
jgi:hypothetical protein